MPNPSATIFNGAYLQPYVLLQGEFLTFYVNAYTGDICAPSFSGSPTKPGGTLVGGKPNVNADGSIALTDGDYGILFTKTSTLQLPSIQAAIQSMIEYVSLGNPSCLEGYSVHASSTSSTTFVPYTNWYNNQVSYNPVVTVDLTSGLITLTTQTIITANFIEFLITHVWTFNDPSTKNVAKCVVTIQNFSASNMINVQYCRAVNPNQDITAGGTTSTNQSFGSPINPNTGLTWDTEAFAIGSKGILSGLNMALGCRASDGAAQLGSTIYAASGATSAINLLTSPLVTPTSNPNNVDFVLMGNTLGSDGNPGATYYDKQLSHEAYVSDDYVGYNASGGTLHQFLFSGTPATPSFSPNASNNATLVLLSPILSPSLAFHETVNYTFYYWFDYISPPPHPPIPVTSRGGCGQNITNDNKGGFDNTNQIQGQSGISIGRVPSPCQPTVCFASALSTVTQATNRVTYIARNDMNNVAIIDTLTKNVYVQCMQWRTKALTLSEKLGEPRTYKKHPKRIRLYGSGVITEGVMVIECDGQFWEAVDIEDMIELAMAYPEPGCIGIYEPSNAILGKEVAFNLVLSGYGIELDQLMVECSVY